MKMLLPLILLALPALQITTAAPFPSRTAAPNVHRAISVAKTTQVAIWGRPDPAVFGVSSLGYFSDLGSASISVSKLQNGYTFIVAQSPMPVVTGSVTNTVTIANYLLYNKSNLVEGFGSFVRKANPTMAGIIECKLSGSIGACTLANIAAQPKKTWISKIGTASITGSSITITATPVNSLQVQARDALKSDADKLARNTT